MTLFVTMLLWNVVLSFLCLLISCSDCGKAAKRGSRHDSGKLVATLCHYYSDFAMGCKECFEVARSHRSNHNSTLLPPCKSVQGIKRRNWTADDGILVNPVANANVTKRVTLASCAFYANNKTFTCVATARPACENVTETDCTNNTSWTGRYEGSISDGFRCAAPSQPKPTKLFDSTWKRSSTTTTTSATSSSSSSTTASKSSPSSSASTGSSTTTTVTMGQTSTVPSLIFGPASDLANEIHKVSELTTLTTSTSTRNLKSVSSSAPETAVAVVFNASVSEKSASFSTPQKLFTLTTLVQKADTTTEFTENCTTTSCTIFADSPHHNLTSDSQNLTLQNETSVHDSPFGDDGENWAAADQRNASVSATPSTTRLVSKWSSALTAAENASTVRVITNGTSASLTSKKISRDDLKLTSSTVQSTVSSTKSSATVASSSSTTPADILIFHTFSSVNKTSKSQEPRKRHPVRRMY